MKWLYAVSGTLIGLIAAPHRLGDDSWPGHAWDKDDQEWEELH